MADILKIEQCATITEHSCILIKTGWSKKYTNTTEYHNNLVFPSISIDAAQFLIKKNIAALGIDTFSPDNPQNGFPVHELFLKNNKIILENVAHLDEMPSTGAYVLALLIKIKDATEAPVRLIGLVKK